MNDESDSQLLRAYADDRSEAAFTELVRRHVDFVYSAALRMAGNAHLAEDVTQGVFVALANNAAHLRDRLVLSSWLHRTARNIAAQAVRTDVRRRAREQQAVAMNELLSHETDAHWESIGPQLDAALCELSDADRDALLLRYFERKSAREMARTLGISDATAQKRVNRAVERLREFLARRGVVVGVSGLAATLSLHAVHAAPAALLQGIAAGTTGAGMTACAAITTTAGETLKVMAWNKTHTAMVAAVGLLLTSGVATLVVKESRPSRTFPWQDMVDGGALAQQALNTMPPQVTIVPSKFSAQDPYRRLADDIGPVEQWRYIGTRASAVDLLRAAYERDVPSPPLLDSEIILPANMPAGFYDYIANLPHGSRAALAARIKDQLGLSGSRQRREMDVLLLQLERPQASGLQPGTSLGAGEQARETEVIAGKLHYRGQPISKLAARLESQLSIPVVDETTLTGTYDMVIPQRFNGSAKERLASVNQFLRAELGLRLEPDRRSHEVLVIEMTRSVAAQ